VHTFLIVAAALGVLGFLTAVAVAVVLFQTERLVRTAPERLALMLCPRCAAAIGAETAALAQTDWQERSKRAHEHARVHLLRLRIDPLWRFRCPVCNAALAFDPGAALADRPIVTTEVG
jgi:hypothetical protein